MIYMILVKWIIKLSCSEIVFLQASDKILHCLLLGKKNIPKTQNLKNLKNLKNLSKLNAVDSLIAYFSCFCMFKTFSFLNKKRCENNKKDFFWPANSLRSSCFLVKIHKSRLLSRFLCPFLFSLKEYPKFVTKFNWLAFKPVMGIHTKDRLLCNA